MTAAGTTRAAITIMLGLIVLAAPAHAQTGSATTAIDGKPAQRVGDQTGGGGTVTTGSPDVMIDGKPAATVDKACVNGVQVGSKTVFINGKPAAITGGGPCTE